jgi:hypothetical protein
VWVAKVGLLNECESMRNPIFCAVMTLAIPYANAATPVGETAKVKPLAELVVTGGGGKKLIVKQPVYSGDTVRTGLTGEAQIVFRDKTRLVVGGGASLKIDNLVYSGGSRAKRFAISAFSGTFRFISGQSAKGAYSVKTPTAVIGVRGTAFDFAVGRGGRTLVMLHNGIVRMCSRSGGCRILDERCELALVRPGQPAQTVNEPGFLVRRNEVSRGFPYVRSQRSLRRDFRVSTAGRCRASIASPANGGGGNGSSGDGGGNSGGRQ